MRAIKSVVTLALLPAALACLTGCEKHSKSETYYLVSSNMKLPYWKSVQGGFQKAATEYNVKAMMRGPDTYDPQAEVQEFRNAVAAKPSGILVSVNDATLLGPEIDNAIAAGVPVITVDSDAPNSKRLYFIGTNNLEAGRVGAQRLVQKLNGKGNVVFFSMPQPNLEERVKGYKDVLSDHPQIKIAEVFNIKGDSGNAFDRAGYWMSKKGADKIDAFVCLEASAGKDVAEVLKRANATDRTLIAMDVDPDTLNDIKSGGIDSTVMQKPFTMGYIGLKALDDVFHNKPNLSTNYRVDPRSPLPVFIDTGTALVDKSNLDAVSSAEGGGQK
ncbi:MAG TPA: substrate-binding domain-containing protein [Terriglobales bacterium]|jgi:ribose transport system substrate-binding protein